MEGTIMTPANSASTLRRFATALLLAASMLLFACGGADAPPPKIAEEELTGEAEVPETVRATARSVLDTVDPDASCLEWFWDREDAVWECSVIGFPRATEIDVDPKGRFSEFEFDVTADEVAKTAPNVAALVADACGEAAAARIELSVRRIDLLRPKMVFDELWGEEGVFVEFQCADSGEDYELDAFGALASKPDDDDED
jgi:hypothetical protein